EEEGRLLKDLDNTFKELQKGRGELSATRFDLPTGDTEKVDFQAFSLRAEEVEKKLREALRVTTKIYLDYERILREMRTNRIQEGDKQAFVEKVENHIVLPLGVIVNDNFRFTISTCAEFRKVLDDTKLAPATRLQRARIMGDAAD